ncbi:MAG: DUF2723 domain-containing protein [Candidatus Krumholzibacteriia bacterium]
MPWLPALVFLAALGVYTATLGPTIDFWDCGEYVTTSHIVGVPHQPGTPLYVLVGRVFDVVFGQADITTASYRTAWAVNFMSAVFSALAVMLVYLIILRVARRSDPDSGWLAQAGALVGALFLLFSDTFWNNAIEAEVYGLAAFMMTLLTWLGLIWFDHRTERRSDWVLLLLIYLCGLGVGFHLGSLLVYPAFFVMVWLATDRPLPVLDLALVSAGLALFLASTTFVTDDRVIVTLLVLYAAACVMRTVWPRLTGGGAQEARWRPFALFGLILFLVGLSVHAMLLICAGAQPEPAINQTVPSDFKTLLSVLRREQYPPLNPLERQAPLGFQFAYYYDFLLRQWSFLPHPSQWLDHLSVLIGPVLLALLGVVHTVRRARPVVWLLVLGYLINGELLTGYLNFTDHEVRERDYFYFAAFLFGSVLVGLGAAALLRWTSGPLGKPLGRLEAEAAPPPPGRPFKISGFLVRIGLAFAFALVTMALLPAATKATWLGLYVFGAAFGGLGIGHWLDRGVRRNPADGRPWNEESWTWRIAIGWALFLAAGVALWLLLQFATPADRGFVGGVFLALLAGLCLPYGERLAGPRPAARPPWPARATIDPLSNVAAVALLIIAALPGLGAFGGDLHHKWFTHDRSENRIAYEYAYNILAGLDEGAVVFTNGDNDTFPIWFLQEVEHFRRDVTVVNLSLVNLPWYIKQLKRLQTPVALSYQDADIDQLRPRMFRDPDSSQLVVVPVRDYVVQDIIETNRRRTTPRPIFFAVTIPRENMARYFPFLQMEGLVYRLTETRGEDNMPTTDPVRLLANVFGAYELGAITTGDNAKRQRDFLAAAGWASDQPVQVELSGLPPDFEVDYRPLLDEVGVLRTEVFRNPSTINLLGNYPASIARAGFTLLSRAEALRQPDGTLAAADTLAYDRATDQALVCYELALRFDPNNSLVAAGYYPALLMERGQVDSALSYLTRVRPHLDPDVQEAAVLAGMRSLVAVGADRVALQWIEQELQADPQWRLGYEIEFRLHEAAGDVKSAAAVVDRWRQVSGRDDPAMRRQLENLRQRGQDLERDNVERAVRERGQAPQEQR